MRFASLGGSNTSDYAAAGKTVADSAAKAFAITRKTGPDYGKLSQTAMVTNAKEKISAMKASEKVATAGIKAYSDVTQTGQKVAVFNKKNEIANKQRKAGGLAAIGKIAGAGFLAATDNTKGRERPKADFSAINENYKTKRDALLSDYDNRNTSSTTTTTGKDDSGKVTGGSESPSTSTTGTGMTDAWAKWSKVIRAGEGTTGDKGYTTMFTGAQFSDFSKHPELLHSSGRYKSDAAGAYQFLSTTWKPAAKELGITDFSPASQEKVGKYLAQKRGLATDTVFTDKASFLRELDKIAPEWASMPTLKTGTSYYGQGGLTPDQAWELYNS
jgi:muramidase (phage lysozyme)